MRSFTLAAMTSLLVCGLGAVGREVTLLVSFVVAMLLMGASSVFEWPCCVCSQTRLGPGPRQQGRQVQEVGFPHPERSGGRPQAGLHKRTAEAWGASCVRQGRSALSVLSNCVSQQTKDMPYSEVRAS